MCFKYTDIQNDYLYLSPFIMCCVVGSWWGSQWIYTCSCDQFPIAFCIICTLSRFLILLFFNNAETLGLPMFEKHWYNPSTTYIYANGGSIPCIVTKMCTRHATKFTEKLSIVIFSLSPSPPLFHIFIYSIYIVYILFYKYFNRNILTIKRALFDIYFDWSLYVVNVVRFDRFSCTDVQ